MSSNSNYNQKGGVSLFVVIFTCLLVTIVTVSFISIMVRNQQQATNTDLSSSAYDSAMAGVEDAKRLAIEYKKCKDTGATCPDIISAVDGEQCDTIQEGLNVPGSSANEVKIQSSSSPDATSEALNQAYTCVKITYNTDDVQRIIRDGETQMIPLRGAAGASFNRVVITWRGTTTSPYTSLPSGVSLPQKSAWVAQPAIMRTQIVQTGSTFNLNQFRQDVGSTSNSNTVFLYPSTLNQSASFNLRDVRPNSTPRAPVQSLCSNGGSDYVCSATLTLKDPVGGTAASRENTFLLVSSIYNAADYNIKLYNGATLVQFDGVQPQVDATGRANDLFRRVNARIEFDSGQFNYPSAALDINGNLCKAFAVTDDTGGYDPGTCTP